MNGEIGRVAKVASAPHAPTRREISRESGVAVSRVEIVLDELRMVFLAPDQGQLPVRILHEVIAAIQSGTATTYCLPCDGALGPSDWMDALPLFRATFRALKLTPEESGYAELLVDPDMLNQGVIAEILGLSGNRASFLRALLRSRLDAPRRNQLRARLLHAAVAHLLQDVHPPSVSPIARPRHLLTDGASDDHQRHDASPTTFGWNDSQPIPHCSIQKGDRQ